MKKKKQSADDEKYKRYTELQVGTAEEIAKRYFNTGWVFFESDNEKEIAEDFEKLKVGERFTCPLKLYFVTRKDQNTYRLSTLSEQTLTKEGFPFGNKQ